MMTRTARLALASSALRRQIWASLPFEVRLGQVLLRLASGSADAFGKTIYGLFLTRGVHGMPDIHGRPAEDFAKATPRFVDRLPNGYGREFGRKAYFTLLKKFKNMQFVEDTMSTFAVRFLEAHAHQLLPGTTLRQAETYVIRSLINQAIDIVRKPKEVSDVIFSEDGEETRRDVKVFDEDTAERQLARMLPRIRHQLRAIHPDAEQYLKLSILDGYTDREILGDPEHGRPSLLDHPTGGNGAELNERLWGFYKKRIHELLKSTFGDVHVSV